MRMSFPALLALPFLLSCTPSPADPAVKVEAPIVTLPALPGRPGAAYFSIRSRAGPVRLLAIESPRIGRVELHETRIENGRSRMRPLAAPRIDRSDPLVFEPGGRHAMLFGIDPTLTVGETVALTFRFDSLPTVTVEAEVRGPGDAGHDDH